MRTEVSINAKAYFFGDTRATWGDDDGNGVHEGQLPVGVEEMTRVKDATIPLSKEKADTARRGTAGWKAFLGTLKDVEPTITMPFDPTDAHYHALMTSYLGRSVIALALLSGGAVNDEGLWADFEVMNMEKGEQLAEAQMITFTLSIRESSVPPEWVRITA